MLVVQNPLDVQSVLASAMIFRDPVDQHRDHREKCRLLRGIFF
jgi:hypothetical protein